MLTEVDTRQDADGRSVSLFMDSDAQVYLVCVEGYEPVTCLTRERAVAVWKHPHAYIALEGSESRSNGFGGSTAIDEPSEDSTTLEGLTASRPESAEELTYRTGRMLHELKACLLTMNDADFRWSVRIIQDVLAMTEHQRDAPPERKPYDQEGEIEF